MNNLFEAFSINVAGQLVDNKKYYEYADYDGTSITVPTDAETIAKGKAYIRMKHLERKLSELSVPIYCEIYFGTAGSCSAIPTNLQLVVGYYSIAPFLSVIEDQKSITESNKYEKAAEVIAKIVADAFKYDLTEFMEFQYTYKRDTSALIGAPQDTYREIKTDYLTSAGSVVTPTVNHIQIRNA